MFPFRLKPPSFGGKLKKAKQEQSSPLDRDHFLRDGGPLQRAIHDDLIAQYPKFVAALQESFLVDARQSRGHSFQIFKKIFANAGIALLHTRLTPQRCDAVAYAQMIYAVCLNLLRRVFQSEEDTFFFGAFAVFLLYSLYETNPYPSRICSETETMPMNLQDRYNPRLTFRRCYRKRIRIDVEHFHYLLQLRDTCLAKVSNLQTEIVILTQTSKVTYSLARDTGEVISRLMENFDYCAYTGPCGLEALAGHTDYPVPPTAVTQKWWKANRQKVSLTDPAPVVPDAPLSEPYKIPIELQEQVEEYVKLRKNISKMQALRDRQGRHARRTSKASGHLFSAEETVLDSLAFFSRTPHPGKKRVKLRHGFVEIPVDASTNPSRKTEAEANDSLSMNASAVSNQEENAPHEVQLILPGGLSTALEESLHDAFETLVRRKAMLPPATIATHPDEVSTLAKSHQSVETSFTGTGRNALRALLLKAASGILSEGQSTTFLESQEDLVTERVPGNDVFSDISSEEGDMTVAGSTVDRSALKDLLSYASATAARKKATKGKKAAAKRAPLKKSKVKSKNGPDVRRNISKASTERREGDSVHSYSPSSSQSDPSSSDHDFDSDNGGRHALQALLARAAV